MSILRGAVISSSLRVTICLFGGKSNYHSCVFTTDI